MIVHRARRPRGGEGSASQGWREDESQQGRALRHDLLHLPTIAHANELHRVDRMGRPLRVKAADAFAESAHAASGGRPRDAGVAIPKHLPRAVERGAKGGEPRALLGRLELVELPVGDLDEVAAEVDA